MLGSSALPSLMDRNQNVTAMILTVDPAYYWLAGVGVASIVLGFVSGMLFLYLLASKQPPGRHYSGTNQIFDAAFSEKFSKPHLAWIAVLTFTGVGFFILMVVIPLIHLKT